MKCKFRYISFTRQTEKVDYLKLGSPHVLVESRNGRPTKRENKNASFEKVLSNSWLDIELIN